MSKDKVTLRELFLVFARIGALSLGGGLTGWVYREVVQQRRWMTEAEFASGMALSQILPGANITNLAVYIGQRLKGTIGAVACAIGLLIVPFFAAIAFLESYDILSGIPWIARAIGGAAAAAIGLMIFATWRAAPARRRSRPLW
jgi:chromate transporter